MSSIQRGQPSQGSFELGSKKKFGKNLNKLQKPPAPPITNGSSQRGSGAARNGLLLLSTKRSSSSGAVQGSGLLSSKPVQLAPASKATLQPTALRKESYTSAHDALVDAVMGASRNDSQKEPDAWKVAEKPPEEERAGTFPTSPGSALDTTNMQGNAVPSETGNSERSYQTEQNNFQRYGDRFDDGGSHRYSRHDFDENWRKSDTEEIWPRGHPPVGELGEDEQGSRMSLLAREHAERRRNEEELRMNEQRERASQRLRELDKWRESHQNELAPTLEGVVKANGYSPHPSSTRSLYDPNKPFSSLLGGDVKNGNDSPCVDSPNDGGHNVADDDTTAPSSVPVIQLSSYDDRDRGETRNANTTPRMLFDPKSGSMVAVADNKAKKVKPKGRREADKGDYGEVSLNAKKKGKGRIEIAINPAKDRRRGDSIELNSVEESKSRIVEPRLPRTCGVLYLRDERGNCFSADGCEGDQGYGCHGVPGGRTRNPVAYAKFEEQQLAQGIKSQKDQGGGIDSTDLELQGYSSPEKAQGLIIDWVKPNEKIELLTGVQESPTLQATAEPWAPSQAALSAAKEIHRTNGKVTSSVISVNSIDKSHDVDDIVDDPDAFIGLGFDPSDMDDVMNSPSTRGNSGRIDQLDLVALSLGVPATDVKRERSIFAFGSSTWGSVDSNNTPTDWTVLGTGNKVGASDNRAKTVGTTPFLSLSSNRTWGSAGLPGFSSDQGAMAD